MGRFQKPDSNFDSPLSNPQGWNLYSYVKGNPVNFNDPTGHLPPGGEGTVGGPLWSRPTIFINHDPAVDYAGGKFYEGAGTIGSANTLSMLGQTMNPQQATGQAAQSSTLPFGGKYSLNLDPLGVGSQLVADANPQGLSSVSEQAIHDSGLTGPQAISLESAVLEAGHNAGVNPNILVGLASKESSFDFSHPNGEARGLFQIRPGRQVDLNLTDEEVTNLTGPIQAVANYFRKYTQFFTIKAGSDDALSLTIASWTMGVRGTLKTYEKGGMPAVRDTMLGDPQGHRVGTDYIDYVLSFQ
jgi:hypothetical protein